MTILKKLKLPPEMFYKKGALKSFTKFAEKHLCQDLFFDKLYQKFSAPRKPGFHVSCV